MQTIKFMSKEFTPVEKYLMTKSPAIMSVKDIADNTSIDVAGFLIFEDEKDDGDVSMITSVITPDKKVYSAQSKTFRESLTDIAELMGDTPFAIIKISGTTKAGRPYVNCILDVDKIQ